jgi:hypothetical protein
MYINQIKNQIFKLNEIPKLDRDLNKWFDLENEIIFLLDTTEDYIPVYFSYKHFFLNSFIVPANKLRKGYIEDLLNWNCGLISYSYSYGYGYSKGKLRKKVFKAMEDGISAKTLANSTPIIFRRFNGHFEEQPFIELNQKIEHLLDIYWLGDKKSYCKLNDNGDFEEIFIVDKDKKKEFTLCSIKQKDLNFYLFLTNSVLVRVFDLDKIHDSWNSNVNYKRITDSYRNPKKEVFLNRTKESDEHGKPIRTWIRGFQIIRSKEKLSKMRKILEGKEDREYASFIINDFKNKKVVEWSSNPKQLGSYFIKNNLPFGTSPVFFNPQILLKYKQDYEKYSFAYRQINCRGAWSINYDINEEGQVHAYIIDLSRLPYEEQLYWKLYNEKPKAGISSRAINSDFLAKWDFDYDPLFSLKEVLKKFPEINYKGESIKIWELPNVPNPNLIDNLCYVYTDSKKEWEDQVLNLAKIVIDGLNKKTINKISKEFDCYDNKLGSITLLAKILEKFKVSLDEIEIIINPLNSLWDLRSNVVAHPNKTYPKGDLKRHFKEILIETDKSMHKLAEIIEKGKMNI